MRREGAYETVHGTFVGRRERHGRCRARISSAPSGAGSAPGHAVLILACVGTLISPAKKAGADTTVFTSGQVFASVGFSKVNVYDPSSGNLINTLTDDTNEPYTTGSAFDANGNFYVTDDLNGDISEFSPDGTPLGQFATGLDNPLSSSSTTRETSTSASNRRRTSRSSRPPANGSPTSDRSRPSSSATTGSTSPPTSAPSYYTTEGTDILRYNKCTNTQDPNFNQAPLPDKAFQLRILPTATCWLPTRAPTTSSTRTAT